MLFSARQNAPKGADFNVKLRKFYGVNDPHSVLGIYSNSPQTLPTNPLVDIVL